MTTWRRARGAACVVHGASCVVCRVSCVVCRASRVACRVCRVSAVARGVFPPEHHRAHREDAVDHRPEVLEKVLEEVDELAWLGLGNSEQATHEAHVRRRHGPVGRALQRARRSEARPWPKGSAMCEAGRLFRRGRVPTQPILIVCSSSSHSISAARGLTINSTRPLATVKAPATCAQGSSGLVQPPEGRGQTTQREWEGGEEPPGGRRSGSRRRR